MLSYGAPPDFNLSTEEKKFFFFFLCRIATMVQCFSMSKSHADSDRSFNVKRHKKDEQSLHRLLLPVAFNYIN